MLKDADAKHYYWATVLTAILLTAGCLAIAKLSSPLNDALLRFMSDTNMPQQQMPIAAIDALTLFILGLLATWCGLRLERTARVVIIPQLLALVLVAAVISWQMVRYPVSIPAGAAIAILGFTCGSLLRLYRRRQTIAQARYHALLLRTKELQEAKLQIVKQDEIERRSLAGDLHDQVLNDLKSIGSKLDVYFSSPDPAMATTIRTLLNSSMIEIREVMENLCPSSLEKLGLPAAVKECLRSAVERGNFRGNVATTLKRDDLKHLSPVELALLYRLVQESLTNVVKHAQAKTVRITMAIEDSHLIIKVADDGKGIDPDKTRAESRGLKYMRQRADIIGAKLSWQACGEKGGTMVQIKFPMPASDSPIS
jgi:two-component system, NarL family, sensor kinase